MTFIEASGMLGEMAADMAADPARIRAAPSMANDLDLMGVRTGGRLPVDLARRVSVPTLVLTGDQSPDFVHATAHRLGEVIPDARVTVLDRAITPPLPILRLRPSQPSCARTTNNVTDPGRQTGCPC